ncbi:MAG: glycosyltransferase family 87 protein [Chloroflexota bacterium]
MRALLRPAVVFIFAFLWLLATWGVVSSTGLFRWVGIDYGFYYSQTRALWSGSPASIYDLTVLSRNLQDLVVYTTQPLKPLAAGPVPYPPLFAWLYTPFTLVDPAIGLALWIAVNAAFAVSVARRVASFAPSAQRLWVGAIVLTSFPVAYTLFVSQPLLILSWAVAELYRNLRGGQDFRAGLWLSLLLLKPQYGLFIGPLLIWKRRWSAVAGVAVGAAVIFGGSLLVAGPSALLAYPAALNDLSGFRGIGTVAYPEQMINWRAFIIWFADGVNDQTGVLLSVALGCLTAILGAVCWRGKWMPQSALFPLQFAVLILVTLLANYHSHVHGTALLLIPIAAALASPETPRLLRPIVWTAVVVPTILFTLTLSTVAVAFSIFYFALILLVGLAFVIIKAQRSAKVSIAVDKSPAML